MKFNSEEAYEKFIAHKFIEETDHIITGKLKEDLANQFDLGVNSYPWNLTNTTNMIINYENYFNNPNHPGKKKQKPNKYL